MKKLLRRLKCRVGIHVLEDKCANVPTDQGKPVTIGWYECHHCGYTKIEFIFSNWKGPTP